MTLSTVDSELGEAIELVDGVAIPIEDEAGRDGADDEDVVGGTDEDVGGAGCGEAALLSGAEVPIEVFAREIGLEPKGLPGLPRCRSSMSNEFRLRDGGECSNRGDSGRVELRVMSSGVKGRLCLIFLDDLKESDVGTMR